MFQGRSTKPTAASVQAKEAHKYSSHIDSVTMQAESKGSTTGARLVRQATHPCWACRL